MVVHSRVEGYGVNHEINSPKISHNFMTMGQYWLSKTKSL